MGQGLFDHADNTRPAIGDREEKTFLDALDDDVAAFFELEECRVEGIERSIFGNTAKVTLTRL